MHNNSRKLEGLLGVFIRPGFLQVGTAEDPVPYTGREEDRDAFKGKQFGVAATKVGRMPKDFFDPTVRPLFDGEPYIDRWAYSEQQPEKLKGFGTGDFQKTGEFAMTIRMEQHRQQLRHEARVQKEAAAKAAGARIGEVAAPDQAPAPAAASQKPLLFDLVFASDTDLCIKAKRDTRNRTLLSKERQYGPLKSAAQEQLGDPGAPQPPAHGHRPAMATVFRKTGAFWPVPPAAH